MPKNSPLKIKTRTGQGWGWGWGHSWPHEGLRLRAAPAIVARLLPARSFLGQSVLGHTGQAVTQASVKGPLADWL